MIASYEDRVLLFYQMKTFCDCKNVAIWVLHYLTELYKQENSKNLSLLIYLNKKVVYFNDGKPNMNKRKYKTLITTAICATPKAEAEDLMIE